MRRQIAWLVVATTSAVVLAFLIPLGLLVRTLSEDRALASANQEAQSVAALVATVDDPDQLAQLVALNDQRSPLTTSVLQPDGTVVGVAEPTQPAADLARARDGQAFTARAGGGAQVLVPVVTADGTAVVRTAVSGAELHHGLAAAWASLVGLGAVLLLASLLVARRLGRRVSAPVTDLAEVAHRLRDGALDTRAAVSGPPEVAELGHALNRLADRIGELLVLEREAVADLSHRLRTPVTALRLDVDGVPDEASAARLRDHVDQLQRTVDAIVRDARRPVLGTIDSRCDAATVVSERIAFWSALAEEQGRSVKLDVALRPMPAAVDAGELADVVDVLVDNVFAHTPEGAGFDVRLDRADGLVRLQVRDQGPGVPDDSVVQRGASGAGSSGLGLDIARRVAESAGGSLVLQPARGGGANVVVTFAPPAG
ncbi:ATP-binding protein [Angustibacter sp. McL0619]|uniref:HAMP domain-containing sensor histidine kinase n=1 Tax=Angustibacter sp. McL0619 TaxID=3415676 RepID=UPI003CEAA10A